MKDNIDSSLAFNRKIIIEIRFDNLLQILDTRGAIIQAIQDLNIFPSLNWNVGDANLLLKDSKNDEMVRNQILIDLNKLAFVSSKIDSIDSFYNRFEKVYAAITQVLKLDSFTRIGCRVLGTYKVKSKKFDGVFESFKSVFPTDIFLDEYPSTDLLFQLNYKNGMYRIGPIKKNDQFLIREFPFQDRNNEEGIGLDADSYLVSDGEGNLKHNKIKDVITASLSVEKSLYEKMKNF